MISKAPGTGYDDLVGRWLSPDPLAGDVSNPQSLNRYAYVLNNPTSLIDPLGLDPQDAGNGCTWDPDTNTLNCAPSGPGGDVPCFSRRDTTAVTGLHRSLGTLTARWWQQRGAITL